MHNLFRLSSLASLEGYYYKPRIDRELLADATRKGLIATTGCPSGEVQTWLRLGKYDEAPASRRPSSATSSAPDNFFCELMDHGLDIERRVRDRPAAAGQRARPAAARDQRPALHARRATPTRTRCCCACSPARRWPTPNRFKFDARRLLPQDRRRRCATLWSRAARRPATTRCSIAERCEVDVRRGREPDAAVPGARAARPRSPGCVKEVERGLQRRYPGGVPTEAPRAGRLRGRRHLPDGLPRLLPRRRRPRPARPRTTASGSARAAARRAGSIVAYALRHHRARPDRARPAVRAVPQPRARLDARHRHRLRRAPARRHDPLRHREVRRGPGRADHHLRHDQGQAGGQGRRPGARLPVRDGRPDHQGDAAAGDGQGHPAGRHLRPAAPALRRGAASSARCTRPTPTSRRSSTPPAGSRA